MWGDPLEVEKGGAQKWGKQSKTLAAMQRSGTPKPAEFTGGRGIPCSAATGYFPKVLAIKKNSLHKQKRRGASPRKRNGGRWERGM